VLKAFAIPKYLLHCQDAKTPTSFSAPWTFRFVQEHSTFEEVSLPWLPCLLLGSVDQPRHLRQPLRSSCHGFPIKQRTLGQTKPRMLKRQPRSTRIRVTPLLVSVYAGQHRQHISQARISFCEGVYVRSSIPGQRGSLASRLDHTKRHRDLPSPDASSQPMTTYALLIVGGGDPVDALRSVRGPPSCASLGPL
jgi:hypothetical protein